MKLHMRLPFKVAAFVLIAACGGNGDPTQITPGATGNIQGNVTDDAGAAVANASVALSGRAQPARTTKTSANGVYTFANVNPGTYTVTVTPPTGFAIDAAGSTSVTVAGGAEANAAAIVLKRVTATPDSCTVEPGSLRPHFGVATAAELSAFTYDASAPLNLQKTVVSTNNGVEVSTIAYSSPAGGTVTGFLFNPATRSSLRPGIVLMHGLPGNAQQMSSYAQALAQYGAVVIAIDAPHARRSGSAVLFTEQDREEQIQLMKDLQRAVDILRGQVNVDDDRIAYMGISYGGAMGVLFAGIEHRIKTAVLVVADGGLVTHFTGPEDLDYMASMSCAKRLNWIRGMAPIEPIRFISHAAPTPLYVQNGRFDVLVPMGDAQVLHAALPQPNAIRWYDAGHGLDQAALLDRHAWLVQQIGLDPVDPN